jgi:ABC-type multidrug transport system fused ATPase/permease subunit
MKTWFKYLKQGLSSQLPDDRIAGSDGYGEATSNLKNLYPYLKRHWQKGLVGVLLVLFATSCGFPAPLITRYFVDKVILDRQLGFLAGAIILLVIFLAAEKLTRMLQEFYFVRFEQRITLDIQQDLVDRVLRFPKAFFDNNQTGYLMSRLTQDVDGIRWFFSNTIFYILSNIIRFVGGIFFLFYLEWRLSIVVLVILPGLAWCIRFFSGRIYNLNHQSMEQKANLSGQLQESLSENMLIKASASEEQASKRLISGWKNVFRTSLQQTAVSSLAHLVVDSTPGMARALVLGVGAFWIIKGQWSLGSLLAFQAYLLYVFGPAQILASANLQLQEALAALQRVFALFGIVPEENMGTGETIAKLTGDVEFKNVSFSYNGSKPVLQDFSFKVFPGERVAIVGPSGVGKTTLLSLILRFYQPTSGEIYFDNRPASDYEVNSLRKRLGYVAQRPRMIAGSIMDNLQYGNFDADESEVKHAAALAGIHDFIEDLPEGYETEIGEKGVKLSEGQKQRISIARALIKRPDIMIFDEPTVNLDFETEKSIFNKLPDYIKNKTVFLVSHHLTTIRDVDRIILLNENKIVATGSREDLLKINEELYINQHPYKLN